MDPEVGLRPHPMLAEPQRLRPRSPPRTRLPDLFAAMQQQLGVRIESGKAPVDVVVIDKLQKPSDN